MSTTLHTTIGADDTRLSLQTNDGGDSTFVCLTEIADGQDRKYVGGEFTADKLVQLRDELTRHISMHRVTTKAAA